MKTNRYLSFILLAGALLLAASVQAEQPYVTNRLAFSARFGYNISAKFKGFNAGALPPSSPRSTPPQPGRPNGDPYNYDDGYVLPDINQVEYGYNDGLTCYWGYDNSASQISGNTILFNRNSGAIPSSGSLDSEPYLGAELSYNHELGKQKNLHFGYQVAANYMNFEVRDGRSFTTRITDAYPFTPGTTPPVSPNPVTGLPFQGSYQGSDYLLIGNTPVSTTTTSFGRRKFESDIWGFRLGPYLETPVSTNVNLSVSGGMAVGFLDSAVSWRQTVSVAGGDSTSTTPSHSDFDVLWGYYLSANLAWQLSERWSAVGGVQYQDLGTYKHSFGGQQVELNLRNSLFLTVGLGYSF